MVFNVSNVANIHNGKSKSNNIYMVLTRKTKRLVDNMTILRLAIMSHFNVKDHRTIDSWLENDNPKLVDPEVLIIIEDITGVPVSLLTEKKVCKPQV